jgi:leader peptidase (prepilin peptidase) / N-methyltransferase
MVLYILFSLLFGTVADYYLCRCFKPPRYPMTFLLSAAASVALYFVFDNPLWTIKGFLFAQMLIIIGYCDAKTHEIPDWLLIPTALTGLIQFQPIPALQGLFVVFLPLLLVAKLSKGRIGGGDVKLMAANGFVLGPAGAVSGTVIGLTLFLILYPVFYRKKDTKAYAMAPYLGLGCFLAYILKF